MIRYALRCKRGHEFEGWFADSAAYDAQSGKGQVACPSCGSKSVTKAPMAPAVKGRTRRREPDPADVQRVLREVRRHIERTHEHVGPRFADEARRIHLGDAPERAIYGEASPEEVRELSEEGVEVAAVPWVPLEDA